MDSTPEVQETCATEARGEVKALQDATEASMLLPPDSPYIWCLLRSHVGKWDPRRLACENKWATEARNDGFARDIAKSRSGTIVQPRHKYEKRENMRN